MPDEEHVSGVKISSFSTAQNIKTSDLITGLQDRENKNFTFGTILAWFRQTIEDFYIAVSEKGRANGVASLDGAGKVTDTQIPFSSNNPLMDGAVSAGTATTLSRSDHRHPSDTSKISTSEKGAANGVASLGSDGKVPSAQLPTIPSASSATPQNLGTAAAGSSTDYSRADHVHSKPSAADVGAQPTITANGILKGDGAGGVSAATAGTDYQMPLTAGTDYATPAAVAAAYNMAASKSKLVRFTAQAVSVASGAEIFRITDADITTDTEVVSVEFANPSYITAGGSWTSYAGYVAFTGTCTAATTADVILKI